MTVLELMEYKDLRTLMTGPHRETLSHQVLLKMVTQAADGLAYLCSKHLVHRDVAARNCLINASYTLKIADLGMAGPPCYEGTKYNKSIIVTRWMAPESLRSSIFTTKSDVWSFGVLLWEISTNCQVPYKDLTHEGVTFAVVNERVTLSPPETTIPPFLKIMTRCWQFDPESRPSFIAIVKFLLQFLSNADRDELENNSFYFSRRDDEINFGTPEVSDVGFIDQSKESNSEASDDLDLQEDRDVERGPEVEISKSKNVYSFTVQENNHKKKFSPILNYEFNFLRNYKEKRRKRPKDKVGIRTDNNLNNENKSMLQNKVYKFKKAKTLQDTPINFCSCDRLPQLPLDDATVGDELHLSNNDFPRHTSRLPIVGAVPCQCDNEVAYLLPNPINISQYFMCQCPDSLTEREERILTYQMPFSTTNFFNNSSNSSHVKKCCLYYCNCNCRANTVLNRHNLNEI
ncbi:Insulin receptor [Armadillidium vulgare]|nr:Insulin receptor [Armadillidium vulgare]